MQITGLFTNCSILPVVLRSRIRSEGSEELAGNVGAKTLYIELGSLRENGYCESFNSKLRDEFLNGEIFDSLKQLQVLAERWRVDYNQVRPHSSLGYLAPEEFRKAKGYANVESKQRFPHLHSSDGGYEYNSRLNSNSEALSYLD